MIKTHKFISVMKRMCELNLGEATCGLYLLALCTAGQGARIHWLQWVCAAERPCSPSRHSEEKRNAAVKHVISGATKSL